MRTDASVRAGGIALIGGAIAFLAVFAFLAARFDYPAVLDGSAGDVLPKLLATAAAGRTVWAVYALLPLIFIPAGVGAFHALRHVGAGDARAGSALPALIGYLGVITAIAGFAGIFRKLTS